MYNYSGIQFVNEMASSGLYVELQPWSYCFFQYQLAARGATMGQTGSVVAA